MGTSNEISRRIEQCCRRVNATLGKNSPHGNARRHPEYIEKYAEQFGLKPKLIDKICNARMA